MVQFNDLLKMFESAQDQYLQLGERERERERERVRERESERERERERERECNNCKKEQLKLLEDGAET